MSAPWAITLSAHKKHRLEESPLVPSLILSLPNNRLAAYWNSVDAKDEHREAIVDQRLVPHFGATPLRSTMTLPGAVECWKHNVAYTENQMASAFRWVPQTSPAPAPAPAVVSPSTVMSAIPTTYANVRFRSRLEARWAAFFDLVQWRWEYEPLDLDGYIPDFVIEFGNANRLVEVKPALQLTDYHEAQAKILNSGWAGPASCVGAKIGRFSYSDCACLGSELMDHNQSTRFWSPWLISNLDHEPASRIWREAGNAVQWKARR